MNYMLMMAKTLLGAAERKTNTPDIVPASMVPDAPVPKAWSLPYYSKRFH